MKVNREERNKKIAKMKSVGLSYPEIAKQLGIGYSSLREYIEREELREKRKQDKEVYTKPIAKPWLDEGKNVVAVDATGHIVSLGDSIGYVTIYNPKLKKAIKEIYHLEMWIQE